MPSNGSTDALPSAHASTATVLAPPQSIDSRTSTPIDVVKHEDHTHVTRRSLTESRTPKALAGSVPGPIVRTV